MDAATDFFEQWSRLQPRAYAASGEGDCSCGRRGVTLYARGQRIFCLACVLLKQVYPMRTGSPDNRLQDSSFLLVTKPKTTYWGNFALEDHYPIVRDETPIAEVKRGLILHPPKTPWMFISFSRSNDRRRLFLTTDDDTAWFSGETAFRGVTVDRVDRRQVMAMLATGVTQSDWRRFTNARRDALDGRPKALSIIKEIVGKYPALEEVTIPPPYSPEAVVFESMLSS